MPPETPRSVRFGMYFDDDLPIIDSDEDFHDVVMKLVSFFVKAVDTAYTYEQLRTSVAGQNLKPLVAYLSEECHHPALVAALLGARYTFSSNDVDDAGLSESRGLACELVAYQFLTFLSQKDLIDHLLFELPHPDDSKRPSIEQSDMDEARTTSAEASSERTSLLRRPSSHDQLRPPKRSTMTSQSMTETFHSLASSSKPDLGDRLAGMNALEIAAISNAKKFISQKPVQIIVEDIWNGDVIFWESLSVNAVKKARPYNKRVADPFTRLRVPKYQKVFQVLFFITLLVLYYAVLIERNPERTTFTEVLLYLWLVAFAYDEFGEIQDAGIMFYRIDFWSLWDVAIIAVGAAFFVTRVAGLARNSPYLIDVAFDILSMVALFLVPRIFSVMSLNPYFGSLIPVLKEMTKAFCKFLPVIIVLYLGFLTTFTMLARDRLTLNEMSWILIKVFFGSSYLGFDTAVKISPLFGYTLMLIFVCLTNILLITSLISLVSNSLVEVMEHAREEYLFQYSIYVLESSTSRRLTYFMPPFNLIPLLLARPLRLLFPSGYVRRFRIVVLKATHLPFVALIWTYEKSQRLVQRHPQPRLTRGPQLLSRPVSASQFSLDRDRGGTRSPLPRSAVKGTTQMDNAPTAAAGGSSALEIADNTDLVGMIQGLSAQVANLTAMVAGQKET